MLPPGAFEIEYSVLVTFIVEGSRKRVFSQLSKRTQVFVGRLCVLSFSITQFLALEIQKDLIRLGYVILMAECCLSGNVVFVTVCDLCLGGRVVVE